MVTAWEDDFTGVVIDYGAWPDQRRPYFTLRDAQPTLAQVSPRMGMEGSIRAGLDELTRRLLGREWAREDGAKMRVDRCLIDANWGSSTDLVYQFCRESDFSAICYQATADSWAHRACRLASIAASRATGWG